MRPVRPRALFYALEVNGLDIMHAKQVHAPFFLAREPQRPLT